MQDKGHRQEKILSLIRTSKLATQSDLVKALRKAGFDATQSSVSRDLVDLGISKVGGFYTVPPSPMAFVSRLRSITPAGESLLVARCSSGLASAITVEIDKAQIPEIVGTLAGDDTIFIAVNGRKAQKNVTKAMLELFSAANAPEENATAAEEEGT